jgi:hypothetical protein
MWKLEKKTTTLCQTCKRGKNFLRKAMRPLNELDNDKVKNPLTNKKSLHSERLTHCGVVNWED